MGGFKSVGLSEWCAVGWCVNFRFVCVLDVWPFCLFACVCVLDVLPHVPSTSACRRLLPRIYPHPACLRPSLPPLRILLWCLCCLCVVLVACASFSQVAGHCEMYVEQKKLPPLRGNLSSVLFLSVMYIHGFVGGSVVSAETFPARTAVLSAYYRRLRLSCAVGGRRYIPQDRNRCAQRKSIEREEQIR